MKTFEIVIVFRVHEKKKSLFYHKRNRKNNLVDKKIIYGLLVVDRKITKKPANVKTAIDCSKSHFLNICKTKNLNLRVNRHCILHRNRSYLW